MERVGDNMKIVDIINYFGLSSLPYSDVIAIIYQLIFYILTTVFGLKFLLYIFTKDWR